MGNVKTQISEYLRIKTIVQLSLEKSLTFSMVMANLIVLLSIFATCLYVCVIVS